MSSIRTPKQWGVTGLVAASWLTLALAAVLMVRHDSRWWLVFLVSGLFQFASLLFEQTDTDQPPHPDARPDADADEELESFAWESGDLRDGEAGR
ncbi:hypothetical protein ACIREE_30620 [Streptomyces sp. NPDC102467]|uniref:hypothetical protein n=1 Tax=Streptomyces sp. NPDC102467 TaxID=3366179 RepID=UPI00382923B1